MTVRTANDILKARVGDLMFEIATVQAENEALKEKLIEVARMLPPEELEKIKLKIAGAMERVRRLLRLLRVRLSLGLPLRKCSRRRI